MIDGAVKKNCGHCEESKSIADFYKNKDGKHGVSYLCKACDNKRRQAAHIANPSQKRESGAKWQKDNPDKVKASRQKWRAENKDKKRESDAEWRARNPEKAKAKARRASAKSRSTAAGKIKDSVSVAVRGALAKSAKRGAKTFDLLGYSVADLSAHLESLFQPGMSWENYGRGGWSIDHKIPQAAFNFSDPGHPDFKRCWALSNLQPMWEAENWAKGDSISAPFQPSLALVETHIERQA